MLASPAIQTGDTIAAYWEIYSDSAFPAEFVLTVARLSKPGFLSRLIGRGNPAPVIVRWTEQLQPADGVFRRVLKFGLPAPAPGEHQIRLTVRNANGASAHSSARVLVRQRS